MFRTAVFGMVVLGCVFLVASQGGAAVTWTAYTFGPSDALANVQGLKRIVKAIEEETKGYIKMNFNLAGSLSIQSTNITQAIGDGVVQFGDDGFFLGNVPIAGILRLPLLLTTTEDFSKALKVMQPYIDREFEKKGAVVLAHFVFPFQVAFSTKKLTSLGDFTGQKLRVSEPEQAEFIRRFGGVPLTMGAPEVPPALQHGTIDGVLTASAGGGKIWGDMLKFNYRLGVNYFNAMVLVNKDAFGKLPPAMQTQIKEIAVRLAPTTTAQLAKEEGEVLAKHKAAGMVITEPTAEEIVQASKRMAPYWDEWATKKGPEAQKALAEVRKALGR
jgi:TRAP-type C4-dicarboxylate transport system substrate-binding protein